MDATADLTRALAEWHRLTGLEGEAILGDDWHGLAEQQTRKAQLQPAIQCALALVRATPSAEACTSPEVERKFDSMVGELIHGRCLLARGHPAAVLEEPGLGPGQGQHGVPQTQMRHQVFYRQQRRDWYWPR